MKCFLYINILVFLFASRVASQDIANFYSNRLFDIALSHQKIDISDYQFLDGNTVIAPFHDEPFNLNAIYFSFRKDQIDKFDLHHPKFHVEYSNLLLGDYLAYEYYNGFLGKDDYAENIYSDNFSTGPFGELNFGINCLTKSKFILSSGLNIADYFIFVDYFGLEGEHAGIGGFLNYDHVINSKLLVRFNGHVNKSFLHQNQKPPGISYPYFTKFNFELVFKNGFYCGINIRAVKGAGGASGRRTGFTFGYRFSLSDESH